MGAGRSDGIADDASDYEDLPEPEAKAKPGIADDAELFADMLDESTDAARRLDSDWLYEEDGQVFGPVKARELVEMLYHWQVTPETKVAPDGAPEFRALRRIGVFQKHVAKAEKHQAQVKQQKAKDKVETRRRWGRNLVYGLIGLLVLAGGGWGVANFIRAQREQAAEEERVAKETAIKDQLAALEASVIIEPPLLPLVEEPPPKAKKSRRRRRGRKARSTASSRTDVSKSGAVGDLSRREIMQGVGAAFPTIKKCIIAQMQRDPETVTDQIVMRFSVNNSGRAQQVSLTDRFLRKSPLRPCLAGALAKVKWRSYTGEVRNIDYPISVGRR